MPFSRENTSSADNINGRSLLPMYLLFALTISFPLYDLIDETWFYTTSIDRFYEVLSLAFEKHVLFLLFIILGTHLICALSLIECLTNGITNQRFPLWKLNFREMLPNTRFFMLHFLLVRVIAEIANNYVYGNTPILDNRMVFMLVFSCIISGFSYFFFENKHAPLSAFVPLLSVIILTVGIFLRSVVFALCCGYEADDVFSSESISDMGLLFSVVFYSGLILFLLRKISGFFARKKVSVEIASK